MRPKGFLSKLLLALFLLVSLVLGVGVCLAVFLPWGRYAERLQAYVNDRLPVTVTFEDPKIAWTRGIGISVSRLSVDEKPESGLHLPNISADGVSLFPSIWGLMHKKLRVKLYVESPSIRIGQDSPASGAQSGGVETKPAAGEGGAPFSRTKIDKAFASLPGGIQVDRVYLGVRNGTMEVDSSSGEGDVVPRRISGVSLSGWLFADLSFTAEVHDSLVDWTQAGSPKWSLAGRFSARATGHILSASDKARADLPSMLEGGEEANRGIGEGSRATEALPGVPLFEILKLPAWLDLQEAHVSVAEGRFEMPEAVGDEGSSNPNAVSGLQASVELAPDHSVQCRISDTQVRWGGDGGEGWYLTVQVGGSIDVNLPTRDEVRTKVRLDVDRPGLSVAKKVLGLPERVTLAFDGGWNRSGHSVSATEFLINATGLELTTGGTVRWGGKVEEVNLSALRLTCEDWKLLGQFLPEFKDLSGRVSMLVESMTLMPGQGWLPAFHAGSFRLAPPPGLSMKGLLVRIAEGRGRYSSAGGVDVGVEGLDAVFKQGEGRDLSAMVKVENLEARGKGDAKGEVGTLGRNSDSAEPPDGDKSVGDGQSVLWRVEGPVSAEAKLEDGGEGAALALMANLTGSGVRFRDLLDKPKDTNLEVGFRGVMGQDEIQVASAFLEMGGVKLFGGGAVRDPGAPVVEVRLMTEVISLDELSAFCPSAKDHEMGGQVRIRKGSFAGRVGKLTETAVGELSLVGTDLRYNRIGIKELDMKAAYDNQTLIFSPVILCPSKGKIQADLGVQVPSSWKETQDYLFRGKMEIKDASLNELITLAYLPYADMVYGDLEMNLIARGKGLWGEEALKSLESSSRVYLRKFLFQGKQGGRKGKGSGIARVLRDWIGQVAGKNGDGSDQPALSPDQARLLQDNNASGEVRTKGGVLSATQIVGSYEGKVVEMQGEWDFSKRLEYSGKLYFGNRMFPFVRKCSIGESSCSPMPDLKAMTVSGAKELYDAVHKLSAAPEGVFKALFF